VAGGRLVEALAEQPFDEGDALHVAAAVGDLPGEPPQPLPNVERFAQVGEPTDSPCGLAGIHLAPFLMPLGRGPRRLGPTRPLGSRFHLQLLLQLLAQLRLAAGGRLLLLRAGLVLLRRGH
jgi:hypothetical protein